MLLTLSVGVAVAAILLLETPLLLLLTNSKDPDTWTALPDRIREHETDLFHVVKLAREGGDHREAFRAVRAKWPDLFGPMSVDKNGNVCFVVSANTLANAGFVCRQGDAEFVGDGFEPTIRETKHLFGPWWYYRSS